MTTIADAGTPAEDSAAGAPTGPIQPRLAAFGPNLDLWALGRRFGVDAESSWVTRTVYLGLTVIVGLLLTLLPVTAVALTVDRLVNPTPAVANQHVPGGLTQPAPVERLTPAGTNTPGR